MITCTLAVHYPHNSGHVWGTVNVSADILCTSIVDFIYISTGLRGAANGNGWAQGSNIGYKDSNAAAPCTNGAYWGIGSGTITFPPGFTPRQANVSGSGVTRTINCSVAGRSVQTSSGKGESGENVVLYTVSAHQED